MKKLISTLLLLVGMMMPYQVYAKENILSNKNFCNPKAIQLKLDSKKLWSDHVLWTRNFIISDIAGLEDKDKVLERLLKNQDDIGESIKLYYGEENSKKLTGLLREHIVIAGQVVDAAKNDKKDDLEKYNKLWYQNADKIADFLSSLNTNWEKTQLRDMLYKHLQLTTDEVVARLDKNWNDDIASYDKGESHMLMFADILSQGIINQFPDKFK